MIYQETPYTDADFLMPNSLFLDGYEDLVFEADYDQKIAAGTYTWDSWKSKLP